MALPREPFMSVEDYLALDNTSKDARYEYLDGELHMLAGGRKDHALIAANLIGILQQALRDSPCQVYTSDIRLQLSATRYVHPDTAVSCDEHDIEQEEIISHPTFVAEVLSPSTEAIDRGKKSIYYRQCKSIHEYLIIDPEEVYVELYRRERNTWRIYTYEIGDIIQLECFSLQLPVEELYRKTRILSQWSNKSE